MRHQLNLRNVRMVLLFALILSWFGCGGGGSGSSPSPSPNPVPNITTLSPSSATAGAAAQTLTINGSNFLSSSTVTYNSAAHTATFVNSTQLTISLTASDQGTAGAYAVVVTIPRRAVDLRTLSTSRSIIWFPADNGDSIVSANPCLHNTRDTNRKRHNPEGRK